MTTSPGKVVKDLFENDDEEAYHCLLLGNLPSEALKGLLHRFERDHHHQSAHWGTLTRALEGLGFSVNETLETAGHDESKETALFPAAFQTSSGQKHVLALTNLLCLETQTQAVQLTLSTLRSFESADRLQSLLGTQSLFLKVLNHHYIQRLSRLRSLVECLRQEQSNDSLQDLLNETIDGQYRINGKPRGIFKRLILLSSSPEQPPSRSQLLPLLELHDGVSARSKSFRDTFVTNCIDLQNRQVQLERLEALEALLVLLYSRTQVSRTDYAYILIAFQSYHAFFTSISDDKRMRHLAGLICAECPSLWRISSTTGTSKEWVARHPLLTGIVEDTVGAPQALNSLRGLLLKFSSQRLDAPKSQHFSIDAPEALGLLAFGLLLSSTKLPHLETLALECIKSASDSFGAFTFLQSAVGSLLSTPSSSLSPFHEQIPYDWQYSDLVTFPARQDQPITQEADAVAIPYASIALEVLSATISAFYPDILTVPENVEMFTNLAGTIYSNRQILCEQFWKDFETYSSTLSKRTDDHVPIANIQICHLLDASYASASKALNMYRAGQEDGMLSRIVPLLRLVSSLCTDANMSASVLSMLPADFLQMALLHCASPSPAEFRESNAKTVLVVLESIRALTVVAEKKAMAKAIGDMGPKCFHRIFSAHSGNNAVTATALCVLSSLLTDESWVLTVATLIFPAGLSAYMKKDLLSPCAKVIREMARSSSRVAFLYESENEAFLNCLLMSILELIGSVSTSLSLKHFAFETANDLFTAVETFMTTLRRMIALHPSNTVRLAAISARDSLVHAMATRTSFGQVLGYFSCAPVSMTIALQLHRTFEETNIRNLASEEYAMDNHFNKFGHWRNLVRDEGMAGSTESALSSMRSNLSKKLADLGALEIDLAKLQERGWINEGDRTLIVHASAAAMKTFVLWSTALEDMVFERFDCTAGQPLSNEATSYLRALSPCRIVTSLAAVPPAVQEIGMLSAMWPSISFSTLDLLTRTITEPSLPRFKAIEVVALTVSHSANLEEPNAAIHKALDSEGLLSDVIVRYLHSDHTKHGSFEVQMQRAVLDLVSCFTSSAKYAALLVSSCTPLVESLVKHVSEFSVVVRGHAGSLLSKFREKEDLLLCMRLAHESLHLTERIHELSRSKSPPSMLGRVGSDIAKRQFLDELIDIILAFASMPQEENILTDDYFVISTMKSLSALGLSILATEAAVEIEDTSMSEISKLVLHPRIQSIVYHCDRFGRVDGGVLLANEVAVLSSASRSLIAFNGLRSFARSFPSHCSSQLTSSVLGDSFDPREASQWLSAFSEDMGTIEVVEINKYVTMFSSELTLATVWGKFAMLYVARKGSALDYGRAAEVSLSCMSRNVELLGDAQNILGDDPMLSGLMEPSNRILEATVSFLNSMNMDGAPSVEVLVGMMEKLAWISEKLTLLFKPESSGDGLIGPTSSSDRVISLHEKLFASISMVHGFLRRNNVWGGENEKRIATLFRSLAEVVGSFLLNLAGFGTNSLDLVPVLRTMVPVLTMLLSKEILPASYLPEVVDVLKQNEVLSHVMGHGLYASKAASSTGEVWNKTTELSHDIVAFIDVLCIASSNCPDLLSILSSEEISLFLVYNPVLLAARQRWAANVSADDSDGVRYRGYLPLSKKQATVASGGMALESSALFLSGKEDPVHALWISTIGLVTSLLHTCRSLDPSISTPIKNLAMDFVQKHSETLLHPLRHCAAFLHASWGVVLTFNVLREASEVLSLVSQLTRHPYRTTFERCCPLLVHRFKESSQSITSSIGAFLGAAGSARELFTLLNEVDSRSNQDEDDFNGFASASDIHPALSAGIANARHEAIRNAHLARRCYALVTAEEYKASSVEASSSTDSAQLSASDLERNCQLAIDSPFQRKLEHAAALCLSKAISVLWRTHATSQCFVMFTKEDAQKLDWINLVKPGIVIAVRAVVTGNLPGEKVKDEDEVRFARVQKVDSVRRVFSVVFLKSLGCELHQDSIDVSVSQLAGVEDVTSKEPLFALMPAPDTASALESGGDSGTKPTIGHLIVALRWCYQHSPGGGHTSEIRCRQSLAIGAAMLLGSELSLYDDETKKATGSIEVRLEQINRQLLQLFDETIYNEPSDDDEMVRIVRKHRIGSLKMLLGSAWEGLQHQHERRLRFARAEKLKQDEERRLTLKRAPWFGGSRSFSF